MTNDFIHCCIFCWGSTMDDCFPLKRYPKTGDSGTAAFLTRCLGRFLVKLLSKKQWPADVIDIYIVIFEYEGKRNIRKKNILNQGFVSGCSWVVYIFGKTCKEVSSSPLKMVMPLRKILLLWRWAMEQWNFAQFSTARVALRKPKAWGFHVSLQAWLAGKRSEIRRVGAEAMVWSQKSGQCYLSTCELGQPCLVNMFFSLPDLWKPET